MSCTFDDIVAVSTPSGLSPKAIIKLSGKDVVRHVQKFFLSTDALEITDVDGFRSYFGSMHLEAEKILIPVSLYVMKAPNSYTREDVVEIHTFGSPPLLEMIFEALLLVGKCDDCQPSDNGEEVVIRIAEPGEFTKRAFLNGRINLAEAESVLRIIRAKTDSEFLLAVSRLRGITAFMNEVQGGLMKLCAEIEASIDFSDQDIDLISATRIESQLLSLQEKINTSIEKNCISRIPHDGVRTVFVGWPNTGKSSLFNKLSNYQKALVSSIRGTTRDVLESVVKWEGIYFCITDTAGMMYGEDELESAIRKRTLDSLKDAHIVLFVFDGSVGVCREEIEFLCSISSDNVIIVLNKSDLPQHREKKRRCLEMDNYSVVETSAQTGQGLDVLKDLMVSTVLTKSVDMSASGITFSLRQKIIIEKVREVVVKLLDSLHQEIGYELIAIDLRCAIDIVAEITGEVATEDILGMVFSEFCIGK
ncbi:MAG: tRNA uridine-5-carboxymethylaminomethyl(34) synthesis GTPase MnmE [Candidatus Scalindua sp. AMX11]|nr:MAG: tRNA uridine-5-carboxymethylaminomethyl(34) synthesis GTPase MnmE [Candidatus Scalindua sp.]NOG83842.1 tRNA uridine-5-carboxymethylaminomethyl(34) synthesis GTPase MnmE [Planctomycetota bacterium]RZV82994.1 MAG: tRNA uridine-5-carboxymethylaminomethyl(34) synthesis GTPase MnmE [Candidatus Scalindua sp. SCAELEC01]TDE64497.1 MAG: tRNA uridine-5-carboxymethylaminomethyl(34) synthesis GTPase MnmE [Candidatus Scalindua sp. AMX11]GJQ58762.1 MAG: tRNA modification GTPase MnmE [Candidatus Scali